jgi:hypothetical protein
MAAGRALPSTKGAGQSDRHPASIASGTFGRVPRQPARLRPAYAGNPWQAPRVERVRARGSEQGRQRVAEH